jgi:tRNA threonylcarbamoyladenosine biosynthesis protein TsaE
MKRTIVSTSDDETLALGRELGSSLSGGEIILFQGGLGAGKTLFTKGILEGLDFDPDEVTSPSFTLVNLYPTEKFDVFHIDLWRIEDGNAAHAVGLPEILSDEQAVVIIEWSERIPEMNPNRKIIDVEIEGSGDASRVFKIAER